MDISFSTLACPTWSLAQVVQAAAASHIHGIDFRGMGSEIDITRLPEFNEGLPVTLGLLCRHGITIPCFSTSVTLVSPAPERWQMMLDECHRYATLAHKTGTPFLRIFGGGLPKGMSHDEARIMAQRHLRQLVKLSRPLGCQVLVETHDDWSTSEAILELLHELDPNEAGILWDIEHPARRGEKPADTAQRLHRYLRYIHLKDSAAVNGKHIPRLLGEGELPVLDCLKALRGVGYNSWICLETEKRWVQDAPEPDLSIPQFAQFMTQHWPA